ncbi:hypothetical protein NLG97_g11183 [Lecanicillium saksenae]|uniref:Uncharacterized protein n=1 Tax=Lecanicillium saksenae TaxID=468837 RepID=A0ACC1QCI2_9HYPO|nr:hypothetical protein NLG97_g11183 [Lecanicillium saksenae]
MGVYTVPDARRQGISKAVFKRALEFSFDSAETEKKSCLVAILAREDNDVAIGMYERLGFSNLDYVQADGNALLYMFKARKDSAVESTSS